MEIVQIVIEKALLNAADRAAKRRRLNRSALVRDALRAYLRQLAVADRERADRAGYTKHRDREFERWDRMGAWPDD